MSEYKCTCEPRDIVDYSRCLSGECGGTKITPQLLTPQPISTKTVGGTLEALLTLVQHQEEQIAELKQKLDRVRKALEDKE